MSDDEYIRECDKLHRDANISAMQAAGWRRSMHLWFARIFDFLGNELRQCEDDKRRGKDDKYHDEY